MSRWAQANRHPGTVKVPKMPCLTGDSQMKTKRKLSVWQEHHWIKHSPQSEAQDEQWRKRELSCMTSRAVVEVTVLKVATRKESMLKRAKAKARVETTEGTDEVTRQSHNSVTGQAGMRSHEPMPVPIRPCLKRGSRDHESDKCPKNQEYWSYMAQALNFTA